jgi:hypothetical protein
MKGAVLYARVSTDTQQKEGTIESQVLELKRQIAAAGDVLVREYVDDGYSGTRLDRPGLEELRRDIRTPLFDAVYFLDTDRIARDVAYQTIILGELLKYDKQIIIKPDYVNNPKQVHGHRLRGPRNWGPRSSSAPRAAAPPAAPGRAEQQRPPHLRIPLREEDRYRTSRARHQ